MSNGKHSMQISVASLILSERDDNEQRFAADCSCIEIQADTLRVEGWVRLPGRQLTIRARCIEAHAFDGRPAVLDVSGSAADPSFDTRAPSPELAGHPNAPAGRAGQGGGPGSRGGELRVLVDEVDGALGLAANGAPGGNSQRGGNGAAPAPVAGADARFTRAKWPERGPFGGGVLQAPGLQVYVSWAAGQSGRDGQRGGNAGAAGRPGDGGNGGRVHLDYTGALRPTLATIAEAGAPGQAGEPAQPGPPGQGGVGGRNRVYVYGVFAGTHEAFARTGQDSTVEDMARKHKIGARAASGRASTVAGDAPAQPVALAGKVGAIEVAAASVDTWASLFDIGFLQVVLARADDDRRSGETEAARRRYDWLQRLTRAMQTPDEAMAEIGRRAAAALLALGPAPLMLINRAAKARRRSRV